MLIQFDNHLFTMTIRIILAAVLSGLVGFEREVKRHPAGFRTHLLVGVGSCVMMLLSLYGFDPYTEKNSNIQLDPSRIPSYVISGIGFLGAGTILVKDTTVKGLTTAASIWVVAGIGLVIGIGMYATALLTTVVVLVSLNVLNRFEKKGHMENDTKLIAIAELNVQPLLEMIKTMKQFGVTVNKLKVEKVLNKNGEQILKQYIFHVNRMDLEHTAMLYELLITIEGIKQIHEIKGLDK